VTLTGYLDTTTSLTDHLAACDVTLNLRWPTARETSGPWLRALAAGRATVITDLVHLDDVPSLDPRTWTVNEARGARREARRQSRRRTSREQPRTPSPIAHRNRAPSASPSTSSTRTTRCGSPCGGWRGCGAARAARARGARLVDAEHSVEAMATTTSA
jgi:hypothetical protein